MSSNTQHSPLTEHGYLTPHKYPTDDQTIVDELNDLAVQLYPTGRAWYMPEDGVYQNFHRAINLSMARLVQDGRLLIEQTIPDNDSFTAEDATLWEYRLGLITNESLDLEVRKAALRRKLGHPNNVKARQHPVFIEHQLQLAGFDVYVHENTIPYQNPFDILGLSVTEVQHGEPTQHGNGTFHGGNGFDVIANSILPVEQYAFGGDEYLWASFFLGGENLGDFATVPSSRLREFKELVIKLKPAHTVAFTFINYL